MSRTRLALLFSGLSLLACAGARADWLLDNEASTLGFVTVKNAVIAESHRFTTLGGRVTADGAVLEIDLASVETLIPIRDERMREMLFQVAQYPSARYHAEIGEEAIEGLAPGETRRMQLSGRLDLHGVEVPLDARVLLTWVGEDRVQVSTVKPIILTADVVDLGAGVEALRSVAGLNSITPMVPISFTLTWVREP